MLKRALLTFLGLLAAGAVGAPAVFALFGSRAPISQPVAFNHRLHVEDNGLACVDCHIYVETQTFAGLPRVEQCMECHEEDQSGSSEEEKIRQAAADGRELAFGAFEGVAVTRELHRDSYIFQRGHRRNKVERLKDDAHRVAPEQRQAVFVQQPHILLADRYPAAGRAFQSGDHHHQRGLARPRRADNADPLARSDR